MSIQQVVVGFASYQIRCHIGIEPNERIEAQHILVDIKVQIDGAAVIKSGNLSDSIDYMQLAAICRDMAQKGNYFLLETYAAEVLETIVNSFHVHWAWMRVRKPSALPGAEYTFIEMRRDVK